MCIGYRHITATTASMPDTTVQQAFGHNQQNSFSNSFSLARKGSLQAVHIFKCGMVPT